MISTSTAAEVARGLQLTGHFLARRVFHHTAPRSSPSWFDCLPAARRRLAQMYQEAAPDAVIFGDLNDPNSAVSQAMKTIGGKQIRADLGLNTGVRYHGI